MPFTTVQRTEAYRFFAIAFAAAPGVAHLRDIELAYEGGAPTKQIVNEYTKKAQFKAVYADSLTDSQFAINLIENVVGSSATAAAKSEASLDVLLALRGGATRGDVIFQIFTNLASLRGDTKWGALAAKLDKQVAVAQYYTETLAGSSDSLTNLRTAIAGVDGTTDTSTAALNARLGPLVGTSLSGKVIDGYIRGASVFIDYNGNGIADLDIEKATATTTDANGGYSLFAPRAGGTITATGGTNIDTGNPNTLVLKAPGGDAGTTTNRTLTPLTTLITQIASSGLAAGVAPTAAQLAAAESTVKASLGLTSVTASLLTLDPVAVANSTTASAADKAAALSVFKVGVQIAVLVKAAQTGATTEAAKLDAAASVITALATTIATSTPTAPTTVDLTKTDTVTKVLSDAKVTVSTTVVQNTVTTSTQVSTSTTTTSVATTQSVFEKSPATPITTTPTTTPTGGSGGSTDARTAVSVNGTATANTANEYFTLTSNKADTLTIPANNNGTITLSANATSYSVSGFDVVSGFASGDTLKLAGFTASPAGITTDVNNIAGTLNLYLLRGNVDSSTAPTSFTVSPSGTSLLMVYDKNGTAAGSDLGAVVLVGVEFAAITGATGGTGGTGGTGVTGVVGG